MLVRVAENVSINMLGIISVMVRPDEDVELINQGWFKKPQKRVTPFYIVEIEYRNADNQKANFHYSIKHGVNKCEKYKAALKVQNDVLNQVKELENVGATQALEEAIRNG